LHTTAPENTTPNYSLPQQLPRRKHAQDPHHVSTTYALPHAPRKHVQKPTPKSRLNHAPRSPRRFENLTPVR
jgi:hypothetical protein